MSYLPDSNSAFGLPPSRGDVEQLFAAAPPSSGPSSAGQGVEYAAPSGAGPTSSPAAYGPTSNTLDEPITDTIKRDLKRIYKNLVMVVFPFKDRSQQSAALRNWDLWGPMVFTITLAIALSVGANKDMSATFSLVFALVSVGAIVLTLNAVLLGGTIGFFQSVCLLGYCIFPLVLVAIICLFVSSMIARWCLVPIAIAWCGWASVPFMSGAVPVNRRALAVYPLVLLYTTLGWLALIS